MNKKLLILFSCIALLFSGITISRAAFPLDDAKSTATNVASNSTQQSADFTDRTSDDQPSNNLPKSAPKHGGASGKSQLVALLLVIFLGGLGIHRFYLGYTWQGVVQLLTAGGCGIWAIIDLIRIITGDLKPKNGSYAKKL